MSLRIHAFAVFIVCIALCTGFLGPVYASGNDRMKIPELSALKDAKPDISSYISQSGTVNDVKTGIHALSDSSRVARMIAQRKNQTTLSIKPTGGPGTSVSAKNQTGAHLFPGVKPSTMILPQDIFHDRIPPRISLPAITKPEKNQTEKPSVISVSENAKAVVQANNQFGIDFFSRLASDPAQEGKNIFFSPWSISSALAITYEGARNTTADEIRSVFHFPASYDTLRKGYLELSNGLNSGNSGVTLNTANALWAEKTYPFLQDYINTADQYYGAEATNLDFVTKPEESRQIINRWVEEKTQNRIKDLIPEGGIDPSTVLAITNAIYFKGTWVKQFDTAKTVEEDFVLDSGATVKVPMMVRNDGEAEYWYMENDDLQVLGMPYTHTKGNGLSMLVLLPKGNDLEAVESSLSAQRVAELNQALTYQRVMVSFPKFKMETTYDLAGMLSDMGMPNAFQDVDFSGMDGTRNLFIDEVYHKAFVEVNEEGTEAAAATAVVVNRSDAPRVSVFRADHPFLFLIQDNDTGNILFMGRVMNPAGA